MSSLVSRLFGSRKPRRGKRGPKYETAKQKAREKDPEARRKVAARTNVEPEILYYLAEDVDRRVRREIARNKAPPPHADVLLARDTDDEVRTELARKIGRLAPRLSKREAGHLEQLTLEALEILARDTLPQVRAIIAEEIKRLDNILKPLIDELARDVELIVAAPILEYSPLLNDDDLLEIISSKPVQGALSAIARREGLSESISDSIAAVFDVDSIDRLLESVIASRPAMPASAEDAQQQSELWLWLTKTATQLRIVSLSGQHRMKEARTLVSTLSQNHPAEVLTVLDGLMQLLK